MSHSKIKNKLPAWLTDSTLHQILLVLIGMALYANTLWHNYTQDDAIVIYDNEFTTRGIQGIPDLFRYDTFRGFFKEAGKDKLVAGGRYRPLTPALFALEWQLFGRSPMIGHLVNALLYGLTGLVLYRTLLFLLAFAKKKKYRFFIALVATLLFLVHPIHTEAVANIKGRDEIVGLLGSLLALWWTARAWKQDNIQWTGAAALSFFLALLSKENAVMFLFVTPLALWVFAKSTLSKALVFSLPLWGAFFLFFAIRYAVLGNSLGEAPMELMNNPFVKIENGQWVDFTFGEWSATITYTLGKYLQLMVWPHPLSHDYYPRHIDIMTWSDPSVWISLVTNLGLLGLGLWGSWKRTAWGFGLLFYFITLSIVSNIVFPIGTNMSERFLYMPSVGLCLAAAAGLYSFLSRKGKSPSSSRLQTALGSILLISLVLAFLTFQRNKVWKDNFTLFTTDVKTAPNSAKLRNSAGGALIDESLKPENEGRRQEMLQEATGHLQRAVKIHPTYKNAYLLLGNAYNYQQQYEAALQAYDRALQIAPNYEEAQNNRFITLRTGGKYFGESQGDVAKALGWLQRAHDLRPDDYETLRLLGVAHGVAGQPEKALQYFQQARDQQPENAMAWWNLANAWYHIGEQEKAAQLRAKARELDPNVGQQQ